MDISHFFNGQYEVASDEYHFSISNDGTYYLYEISDKNSNLIRETDKQNGVVKNKNGEFYYKDYDDNGNRVLNYCNGKNLLKVADYSEEDYFKLLNKDYYVLWNFDNKNYSIVHNGKIVGNIDTDVSKMDLFVIIHQRNLLE